MKIYRFYCAEIQSKEAFLDAFETHHLAHVLRLNAGDSIELFDGNGRTAKGKIDSISQKTTRIRIEDIQVLPTPKSRIILAVSMAKSQRFDFLVEKCTELGVDHIAAVQFDRTVKLGKESFLKRYSKICISAAKQSGRVFLPELSGPSPFQKTIDHLRKEYSPVFWIYGDTAAETQSFLTVFAAQTAPASGNVIAVVGPEGGLTDLEKKNLQDLGAHAVNINANILRIETAAVAFCCLLSLHRI